MRIIIVLSFLFLFAQCKPGSDAGSASAGGGSSYEDYCVSFDTALNGVFEAKGMNGTMTWFGGREGTVDILGEDYNDMTCTFKITDCENGNVSMICNGGVFDTQILLFSPDSIEVNMMVYTRVK